MGERKIKKRFLISKITVLILICFSLFYAQCSGGPSGEQELSANIDSPAEEETTIEVGTPVSFLAAASGGKGTITYSWDFGASGIETKSEQNPGDQIFATEGTFTVTLTATDGAGNIAADTVTITAMVIGDPIPQITPPIVTITPEDDQAISVSDSVSFSATVTGGEQPFTYSWDFDGDGTTDSTVEDPGDRIYDTAGTFTVTCTATDGAGNIVSDTVTIIVTTATIQVVTGGYHTCRLLDDGGVECWGTDAAGQLGNGPVIGDVTTPGTPVIDSNGTKLIFTQISAGSDHTCGVKTDGSIQCWGEGQYGRLGNLVESNQQNPTDVTNSSGATEKDFTQVTAGSFHTCGLKEDRTVWCWGWGLYGELGNGSEDQKMYPVQVVNSSGSEMKDIVGVSAGASHTCAVKENGKIKCWGRGKDGRLGNGDTVNNQSYPVNVVADSSGTLITNFTSVSAGGTHTCATLDNDTVKCWGPDSTGQVGDGSANQSAKLYPVAVVDSSGSDIQNIGQVSAGLIHSCAVLSTSGEVRCWGHNYSGQVGNKTNDQQDYAVSVKDESGVTVLGFTQVSAGTLHTCGLMSDGTIMCWGFGDSGQLGDGEKNDRNYAAKVVEPTP